MQTNFCKYRLYSWSQFGLSYGLCVLVCNVGVQWLNTETRVGTLYERCHTRQWLCIRFGIQICPQQWRPPTNTHTHNRFTAVFPGPPGWADARRELLDFMVQGKINRGKHTDHPDGRHSIRTNQYPPPPSPHFFYRPDALPAAQPTVSKHWRQFWRKEVKIGKPINLHLWSNTDMIKSKRKAISWPWEVAVVPAEWAHSSGMARHSPYQVFFINVPNLMHMQTSVT